MSVISKALSFPSFLFSVFVFYWSLPLFAIIYRIRFMNVSKRNDMLDWAKALVAFFRVTVLKQGEMTLYRGARCLYLCNHRSWADFFIDTYLTEGRAALMSRWLVYFVFPVFCTSVIILRGIVLFKRGHIANKEDNIGGPPIEEEFVQQSGARRWTPAARSTGGHGKADALRKAAKHTTICTAD
ncbi:hypothetical protein Vretimale_19357 [Volvox reticuliferus]|uniref:Phospholipid/glycerol acyltransferase domain-containing protein n=1 Tax=Volvox reticuliferus TaxID=1737510 RepID=A0A8J4GWL8_9CHLO|nr:hypothetical protein Vretimale_19357 [Volvox reticuliferus]